MEEVNITEPESRYFSDLFACCDTEKTGKISPLKATEMFRSSNIPDDVLENIMSLAGIPQTALYMSKVQFYSCLKLIAAHQSAVPLRKELIASTIALPLPRFSWKESPVPLKTDILNALNDVHSDFANSDITSTDSEVEHSEVEKKTVKTRRAGSPAWSTASDSPTPTNSVAERPWAKGSLWQGQLEERTQLLGTEEESSDRHSSDDDNDADLESVYEINAEQKVYYTKQFQKIQPDIHGLISGPAAKVFFEKSRIPVEELRHIWQLCDVTKDGALNLPEFAAAMHLAVLRRYNVPLPPILPECLVPSGAFFEPTQPAEGNLLQLDDDKQPASISSDMQNLSFDKHLIKIKSNSLPHGANNHLISAAIAANKTGTKSSTSSNSPSNDLEVSPTKSAKGGGSKEWANQSSKEWTKFTESPTSNVSSPGPKPVNFDMQRTAQAVVCNPDILHPKPLRITPVANDNSDEDAAGRYGGRKAENADGGIITIRDTGASSPKSYVTSTPHRDSLQNDLRPIQRPQAKKLLNSFGAIPPPPQRESLVANQSVDTTDEANVTAPILARKDSPPTPPPRSQKHARSSSLDLKKLKLNAPVPPEVPPRVSPQMTAQISLDAQLEASNSSFADFTQCPEPVTEARNQPQSIDNDDSLQLSMRSTMATQFQSSQRSSAFEVYRKPTPRESTSPIDAKAMDRSFHEQTGRVNDFFRTDSKNLNDVMCHLKEQNQLLISMCNDLSDELLTVQQKKVELKSRIDSDLNNGGAKDLNNQSIV